MTDRGLSDLINVRDAIEAVLGPADFEWTTPGVPVPRPSGKPIYGRSGIGRGRYAAKLGGWDRLWQYRDDLCISLLRKYPEIVRTGPFDHPVICVIDFIFPTPKSVLPKKKRGAPPETTPPMVTSRPDVKNLIFSVEDALAAPPKGQVRPYLWRGLWRNDSQCHTIPFRFYSLEPSRPRTEVRVWVCRQGKE